MGYKRTERTSKAEDVPIGTHRARIVDIGEKEIMVDEYRWEATNGQRTKVKTGNKIPETFMEWSFQILDTKKEPAPSITTLYRISWYSDEKTGMRSKLIRSVETLGLLPEIGQEFEPDDAIGREVEVNVVHKPDENGTPWSRIEGPIVRVLDGGQQCDFND